MSLFFDDVYFSKEGGWEESRYVFLEGNRINIALLNETSKPITIGELGFGTGLNFFMTLYHWMETKSPPSLQYNTLEGFPLPRETLHSLNLSFPDKDLWTEFLLESYTIQLQKWKEGSQNQSWDIQFSHPNGKEKFDLRLYFGDVADCLDLFPMVDYWYLDGFSPSKNPKMWSEETLSKIRSHSRLGTRLATFTAAGFIRRNLEGLGFTIQKQKGFGKKREMITGILL
ncbi:tRNA (5-methylaminomethyl-2-thiouridine)(34)-methyltransferase MnmD [Leptospira sp. WS39.C2]